MWVAFAIAGLCGGSLFVSGDSASAQKQDPQRVCKVHDIMAGIVGPNCGALKKVLDADQPDWKKAKLNAALLNEVGHLLVQAGRCPDAKWAEAANTLRDCSAVVAEKINAEDASAAKGAFGAMTKACKACHDVHKKK
jgi:hypothetical protein